MDSLGFSAFHHFLFDTVYGAKFALCWLRHSTVLCMVMCMDRGEHSWSPMFTCTVDPCGGKRKTPLPRSPGRSISFVLCAMNKHSIVHCITYTGATNASRENRQNARSPPQNGLINPLGPNIRTRTREGGAQIIHSVNTACLYVVLWSVVLTIDYVLK